MVASSECGMECLCVVGANQEYGKGSRALATLSTGARWSRGDLNQFRTADLADCSE